MTTNGHCRIDTAGTYTLTATSGTLDAATSGSFTIFGTAAKLVFTTSSSGSTGGIAFPTQPMLTVQDAGGNTVTTSTVSVTLSIPAGTPVLTCSRNPMNAVAGVAAFAGCKIDKTGTYTLTAASSGLASVTASVTIIVGPATKLAFTTSPSNTAHNVVFTTQPVVKIQDAGGNTVNSTASVTLGNPAGATLTCTTNPKPAVATNPKPAVAGVATFAGCRINNAGTYTLTATSGVLTAAVSNTVTIS